MNDVLISPKEICLNLSNYETLDTACCKKESNEKANEVSNEVSNEEPSEKNNLRECFIDKSTQNDPNLECIICFEKNKYPIVTCSLCSNYSHYTCYKKFTKKNNFYKMKCVHCGTRSVRFRKKWWQTWWCYG
jgi:hypothetical protein